MWPFWWHLKHSTVLRQFVDSSSSALVVRPLVPFLQLLLDRVLSAHMSIVLGFGVGILTPKICASSCVEILGLPPIVEVFFGVSSNIPVCSGLLCCPDGIGGLPLPILGSPLV